MKSKAGLFNRIAVGLASIFVVACTGLSEQPKAANESSTATPTTTTWTQALVNGQVADLKKFDEKFRESLGLSDLEANQIGCVTGCDQFLNPTLKQLVYVFPREYPEILSHFGKAWAATKSPDPDFTLAFDGNVVPSDCDNPIQDPPPCQSMPFCAIDRCGRMVSGVPKCSLC